MQEIESKSSVTNTSNKLVKGLHLEKSQNGFRSLEQDINIIQRFVHQMNIIHIKPIPI